MGTMRQSVPSFVTGRHDIGTWRQPFLRKNGRVVEGAETIVAGVLRASLQALLERCPCSNRPRWADRTYRGQGAGRLARLSRRRGEDVPR